MRQLTLSNRSAVQLLYRQGGVMDFELDARVRFPRPVFPLGRLVATPGALELLRDAQVEPTTLLDRHVLGDWSDVSAEDARENVLALKDGSRIMSSYMVGDCQLWVLTEADRSVTTILRPDEY